MPTRSIRVVLLICHQPFLLRKRRDDGASVATSTGFSLFCYVLVFHVTLKCLGQLGDSLCVPSIK